jgi:hypothetical protein
MKMQLFKSFSEQVKNPRLLQKIKEKSKAALKTTSSSEIN